MVTVAHSQPPTFNLRTTKTVTASGELDDIDAFRVAERSANKVILVGRLGFDAETRYTLAKKMRPDDGPCESGFG